MMADKELGIGSIFTNAVYGAANDGAFASYYQGQSKSIEKRLERCIEDYKKLGN